MNYKSEIIPDELKYIIDEVLEKQLLNANRYFAESTPHIASLMEIEKVKSSKDFLEELKKRWEWHNVFYEELLEPAYFEIIKQNQMELSPKEIEDLINIYETCCLVDETTLVTSGAIKKHLEYHYNKLSLESEEINKIDARFMLLTPPVDTFFIQYYTEHLEYIVLLKTDMEKAKKYKQYLLEKYHANDEIIFKGRFYKSFSSKIDCNVEELLKEINSSRINEEYKIRHFYFTLEHDERKNFRDLIIYDNVTEKFIANNLIGISGFIYRKKILEYLNDANILKNNGFIYEFSKDTIISCLRELLKERSNNMEFDVKPYKQKGNTCAIACMLMTLDYFKIVDKINWYDERKYYKIYKSKYMEGTPLSALAYHFSKNGLETEIMHSSKNIFDNDKSLLSDYTFNNAMDEYKEFLNYAKKNGTTISNGVDISSDIVREYLSKGKIVILAGQVYNNLHTILVCGYDDDKFIVCDPLYKNKQIRTKEELNEYMTTGIGKWMIVVGNKKLKKEKLIENLPSFKKTANEKLTINSNKKNTLKK